MLVGCLPFVARDSLDTLRAHVEKPVPPLPTWLPLLVRQVVEGALSKHPAERFASATQMAAALRGALATLVGA